MNAQAAPSLVGKRLDKTYEIIAKLGEGGMGVVYEAQHAKTGRRVAIKVISSQFADDTLVARFQREARAAGAIDSRHIAQVLDAGTDPETGAPYLVMELLKGRDLDQLMKRFGTLRPTLALRIVAQALAGLERAHGKHVIHRDIKPANLFVAEGDGNERIVKLVDFGVAKVKDDVTASREYSLTQTASLLGSPLYMSPEQARTSKTVDGRADLWSLGTVLYQLLSGEAPHHLASSLTELLLAICTEAAPPVQNRAPWVTPEIASIVAKSLEIDASRRYPNASAMLADIEAIIPDWQRLEESMITPMTDAERDFIAKKAEPPPLLHASTQPNGSKTISDSHIAIAKKEAFEGAGDRPTPPLDKTSVYADSQPGVNAISAPGNASHSPSQPSSPSPRKFPLVPVLGAGVLAVFAIGFAVARSGGHDDAKPLVPTAPVTPSSVAATTASAPPSAPPPVVEPRPTTSLTPIVAPAPKPGPKATPSPGPAPAPKPGPVSQPTPAPAPKPNSSSISRDFN